MAKVLIKAVVGLWIEVEEQATDVETLRVAVNGGNYHEKWMQQNLPNGMVDMQEHIGYEVIRDDGSKTIYNDALQVTDA